MDERELGPQPFLTTFARAISSASDPELAAWQERGIERPFSPLGILIWTILVLAAALGTTGGLLLLRSAWHALSGFDRAPPPHASRMTDPMMLLILAFLVTAIVAGAVGFVLFQLLTRGAFALRRGSAS